VDGALRTAAGCPPPACPLAGARTGRERCTVGADALRVASPRKENVADEGQPPPLLRSPRTLKSTQDLSEVVITRLVSVLIQVQKSAQISRQCPLRQEGFLGPALRRPPGFSHPGHTPHSPTRQARPSENQAGRSDRGPRTAARFHHLRAER